MPREITHDAHGPHKVDAEAIEGGIAICMCGLSDDYPFCDGSHASTTDEDPDTQYKYENDTDEGARRAIAEIVFADE